MRIMRESFLALVVTLVLVVPAFAVQPDEVLPDPKLELRARAVSAQLRCLVCQNQSIDDSDAPLARDLRLLVRERLVKGDTDAEVVAFIVERYGEFVLLKPRFAFNTLLLWLTPVVALLAGGLALWRVQRRRQADGPATGVPLSDDEKRKLAALLGEQDGDRPSFRQR